MTRSPEQRWQRAAEYLAQGQVAPARAQLEALRSMAPSHVRTHLLAARIAFQQDKIRDAARYALEAAEASPDEPESLCETIEALLMAGEVIAARECLARPALARNVASKWLLWMADFRQRLHENVEALALIERACAAGAEGPEVRFHLGVQLYFSGRGDEAERELEAALRSAPTSGRAALALARLRVQTAQDNHLDLMDEGLRSVVRGSRDHAALLFARYKELEDLERYDEAWEALETGNALMHRRNPCRIREQRDYLHRLTAISDGLRRSGNPETYGGPQPIFILGMARSGTTLLERMLGNHSCIAAAGELTDLGAQLQWAADTFAVRSDEFLLQMDSLDLPDLGSRYLAQTQWRARGKPFFIDKQPSNWPFAGLIHAALPGARILHLARDPMDLCFSNWRSFFGDTYEYTYDMQALAAHHEDCRRTMAHWRESIPSAFLEVSYPDLVNDPQKVMHEVLDFCGLAWEPACSDVLGNAAPVATLSAAQVRQSIRTDTGNQWRRYASQLLPLREALNLEHRP